MTTDTPQQQTGLRFDFNKAVEDARRDFPAATAKVAFFDLDAPDVDAQMQKFYDSLSPAAKKNVDNIRVDNPDFLTSRASPAAWRAADGSGVGILMAYGARTHLSDIEQIAFNPTEAAKHLNYTFQHELGHLVVKGADRHGNYAEHAADAFAVLRGFQSGFLNRRDVKEISDGRAMLCWLNCDVTHITSMSLDALIINPKQKNFMSLDANQTAKLAARHAEKFSTNYEPNSMFTLLNALPRWALSREDRLATGLDGLANVVLKTERSSLSFYVAARILTTAKAKQDAGDPKMADADFTGEKWDKVFARIDRARKSRDIGAEKAVEKDGTVKPKNAIQKIALRLKPLSV